MDVVEVLSVAGGIEPGDEGSVAGAAVVDAEGWDVAPYGGPWKGTEGARWWTSWCF